MTIIEKMKQDWDRRADIDARYWVEPTFWENEEAYHQSAVIDTASLLDGVEEFLPKESRILDIGCGIGRMMDVLADTYKEVSGVDVSGEMIKVARNRLSCKKNINLYENNGVDLSLFAGNRFDFVYSFAALPHVAKTVLFNYFKEVSRVLTYKGIFKVQLWKGETNILPDSDTITPRVLSEEEFQQLYKENGFTLLSIKEHDYMDPILHIHPVWCTFVNLKSDQERDCESEDFTKNQICQTEEMPDTESRLLLYYGSIMIEKGNDKQAKKALTEALLLDPKSLNGYNLLVSLLLDAGEKEEAVEWLKKAVREIPEYTEAKIYLKKLNEVTV